MGQVADHTPADNEVTKPVEGRKKWQESILSLYFVVAGDQAEVEGDDEVGEILPSLGTFNWLDPSDAGENVIRSAVLKAATAFSNVANIDFSASATFDEADIKIVGADHLGTTDSPLGNNVYGQMDFPGGNADGFFSPVSGEYESFLLLNKQLEVMTQPPSVGGGHFALRIALHELGHGLGLGHPHDDGNGTTDIASDRRDDSEPLDNERYTVMSYETGGFNQDSPRTYGHAVTPMAIDIAALQNMYGARPFNTGDSSYELTYDGIEELDTSGESISIGSAWYCIWDSGGEDTIFYDGVLNCVINLNDASLDRDSDDASTQGWARLLRSNERLWQLDRELTNNLLWSEYHAGGFFSRIFDNNKNVLLGGYSIAHGVQIENGTGGQGNDVLVGNEAANRLTGNDGNDLIVGSDGDDSLIGGAGNDTTGGGAGNDHHDGGAGAGDVALFSDICSNYEIEKADDGTVTVSHVRGRMTDGIDTLVGVETARFTNGDIDLTQDDPGCPSIDFIFLVDLSGSFLYELPDFAVSAASIAASVSTYDSNAKFALASFVDIPVPNFGHPGDYAYRPELALTGDIAELKAALAGLSTRNGGDEKESQWVALNAAARGIGLELRENSHKIILIATDAPAHSASDYGLSESGIQQFIDDNAIDVIGNYEVAEPGDVGDTNPQYDDGLEPLFKAFADVTGFGTTQVIFAVKPIATAYYESAASSLLTPGAVVTLGYDAEDLSDAVSLGLAELYGQVSGRGNWYDDSLIGTAGTDGLFGLAGNDIIRGLDGDDLLDGGSGDDSIDGGRGNDEVTGGTGDDTLRGFDGDDVMRPGLGADLVATGNGADTVAGTVSELDGVTITDFSIHDTLVFDNALFTDDELTVTPGSAIVEVDSDGDGVVDATVLLLGNFDGKSFVARPGANGLSTEVTIANNEPTGEVSISGEPRQGATLSVSNTLDDADDLGTIGYQWYADGVAIDGATGETLPLGQELVARVISVVAGYTDGNGRAESVSSAATEPVANVNDAPDGSVTITGSAYQGETLSASVDLTDLDGLGEFGYQWWADGSPIEGATGESYVPGADVVGSAISVTVGYTDLFGTDEQVESDATLPVRGPGALIEGSDDADSLLGAAGDDTVEGRGGADTLDGGAGDDLLDGGPGHDVAVFSGSFADYDFRYGLGDTSLSVADRRGVNGTDLLLDVESLQFQDGVVDVEDLLRGEDTIRVFFNARTGQTIYTADARERQQWLDDPALEPLGQQYAAPLEDDPGVVPVYRVYSSVFDLYLWTALDSMRDLVLAEPGIGIEDQGVAFHAYADADTGGTKPIHMLWDWNPTLAYPQASAPAPLNILYADEPLLPFLLDRPGEPAVLDQGVQFWL